VRSGLRSDIDFLKHTTFMSATHSALDQVGPAAVKLAEAEGLQAHAPSVARRLGNQK
jgi:histidinol dehydrogenase